MRKLIYFMPLILLFLFFIAFSIVYLTIQYNSLDYIREGVLGKGEILYTIAPSIPGKNSLSHEDLSNRLHSYIDKEDLEAWNTWMDLWETFKGIPKKEYDILVYRDTSKGIKISQKKVGFIEVTYVFKLYKGWKIDYIDINFAGEDN